MVSLLHLYSSRRQVFRADLHEGSYNMVCFFIAAGVSHQTPERVLRLKKLVNKPTESTS